MSNPDSNSNNPDAERDNGFGNGGLEATQNFSSSASLDATGAFDSRTRPQSADATAAYDSSGRPLSGSASESDRPRSLSTSSLIGTVIGGYRIVAPLGQGGMGRVFRADDSSGRPVAIKLLSPDLARSSEALARFKQEGLIASQINHSRCVFVHRVDEDAGTPFIAMELMTGLTLKDLVIQKGPLPHADALRLILQCIEGLVEAHSRGMIHRDIKPANCYLDSSGNVKIGDFGLARSLVSDSELTQTGAFIGTPLFASPEQLLGQEIDVRSDIYSLTATLYFLLAGKAPFESPHAAQVIARIASSDPPPFDSVDVEVPDELERIVMKGLSRDSTKRYQSFVEMQTDLLLLLAPKPESASLGRRIVAGLADSFLMSLGIGVLALMALPISAIKESNIIANAFGTVLVFLYFFLSESIFATSLGKAALRIRVADANTGRRAGLRKISVRAISYAILNTLSESAFKLMLFLLGWAQSEVAQGLIAFPSMILTYLAFYSTWRYTKKRQLLHDWLSGTECLISVPPVVQITQLELPDYAPPAVGGSHQLCTELGRFNIIGEIAAPGSDNIVRWLSAEDPQLDRSVWIAISQDTNIDYELLQCTKDPSTRLRFIEQGITARNQRWFAYVAPEGIPLQECLANGVHFAWPVTSFVFRQLIAHFQSVAASGSQATIAKLSDWWVDRAGRMSIVSLATPHKLVAESVDYQAHDQSNLAAYQKLLQTVCLLALPRNHKLRRKLCNAKLNSKGCLLAREALPPLRSMTFCESVASAKYTPALKALERELARLNKGNHCVNSKTRFLNAVLSLSFSIPVLAITAALLLLPGITYLLEVRKDLQCLATFETIVNSDQPQQRWWSGASDEQQLHWTSPAGRSNVSALTAETRKRLTDTYSQLGKVEQTIVSRFLFEDLKLDPPLMDLNDPALTQEEQASKTKDVAVKVNSMGVSFQEVETDTWDRNQLNYALKLAEFNPDTTRVLKSDISFVHLSVYLVIGLAIWTWLTFGGMSTRVTGICFVSRDGTRMGLFRSGLRALVAFLPIIILVGIVAYWPLQSINDIWWTTQLKRVLLVAPLFYLASTLFWNNRTIADVLSNTTAIPR